MSSTPAPQATAGTFDNFQSFVATITTGLRETQHLCIAFGILVILTQASRIYVRLGMVKQFAWDDRLMCITTVSLAAFVSVGWYMSEIGEKSITDSNLLPEVDRWRRAFGTLYSVVLIFWKLSVSCYFYKIFAHRQIERAVIWVAAVLTTVSSLAYAISLLATCGGNKTYEPVTGSCAAQRPVEAVFAACSVINILGDIAFAAMAGRVLYMAKLPIVTKATASLLIAFGMVGAVATAIRLYWTLKPVDGITYFAVGIQCLRWAVIELGIGILATNLCTHRPLFHSALTAMHLIAPADLTYGDTSNRRSQRTATVNQKSFVGKGQEDDESPFAGDIKREVTIRVREEMV